MMGLLVLAGVLMVRASVAPIGYDSMPPIRYFEPYHRVGCPKGYSLWWPANREFDDDKYAECVKYVGPAKASAHKVPHKAEESRLPTIGSGGKAGGSK